jgi:hypothetical protein
MHKVQKPSILIVMHVSVSGPFRVGCSALVKYHYILKMEDQGPKYQTLHTQAGDRHTGLLIPNEIFESMHSKYNLHKLPLTKTHFVLDIINHQWSSSLHSHRLRPCGPLQSQYNNPKSL